MSTGVPGTGRAPASETLTVLSRGAIELRGRLPWSSNATFLATVTDGDRALPAVYKPCRGERPLYDFPDGLHRREVAAYELSVALGWDLVPETVVRHDGPLGAGSLQRFVPADFSEHYFTLLESGRHDDALKAIATFDLVANSADRKSGHCLLGEDGRVWAIDNGLCFHAMPKLRTVMWDFAGEPIPSSLRPDLERVSAAVPVRLRPLLSEDECEAVSARAAQVLRRGRFPEPSDDHRAFPWPLV
jgi:uncharacterized repeat protein (TIGR03843 family)